VTLDQTEPLTAFFGQILWKSGHLLEFTEGCLKIIGQIGQRRLSCEEKQANYRHEI
jgi:hypothetical protein